MMIHGGESHLNNKMVVIRQLMNFQYNNSSEVTELPGVAGPKPLSRRMGGANF
jgi:hypothetical protein